MERLIINYVLCLLLITTFLFVATPAIAAVDITVLGGYVEVNNIATVTITLTYSEAPDPKPTADDIVFELEDAIITSPTVTFGEGNDGDPKTYFITYPNLDPHEWYIFKFTLTGYRTVWIDIDGHLNRIDGLKNGQLVLASEPIPYTRALGINAISETHIVTTPADTDNIEFKFQVTKDFTLSFSTVTLTITSDIEARISDHYFTMLAPHTVSKLLRVTVPRSAIIDGGVGQYKFILKAEAPWPNVRPGSLDLYLTVRDANEETVQGQEETVQEQTDTVQIDTTATDDSGTPDRSSHQIILSEFMFESEGGDDGLPQWIEVYNNTNSEINMRGWKFQWRRLKSVPFEVTTTFSKDFRIPAQQARLVVYSLGRHSGGGKLSDDDVYQLQDLNIDELMQVNLDLRNRLIGRGGFSLKLLNSNDVLVDQIGTITEDEHTWQLHECMIEGDRSSLIRRFDEGVPRVGTEKRSWRRAFDTKRLAAGIYYGHPNDFGTPGYRRGKALPVELSQFSAKFDKNEVVINWITESELNNAGFNILRSTSPSKDFQRINVKLIQGAGTTGQRTKYQFIDKTAKPNVAYYYRIEDVDFAGTRTSLTTYQLRGVIAPDGKDITIWGTLKGDR